MGNAINPWESQDNIIYTTEGEAPTLGKTGTLQRGGSNVMDKVPNIVMIDLNTASGKSKTRRGGNIRRLTEIECERLQGYPDNWTKYGNYDGVVKEISRTQRYKLCGNAVTKNIVELIGRKIIFLNNKVA